MCLIPSAATIWRPESSRGDAWGVAEAEVRKKILITGRPGVGKTTVIRKFLAGASSIAGGFLTAEIRQSGRRVGFRVEDVHDGTEGILAHADYGSGPRVGKYRVDVAAFERLGVKALSEALRRRGTVIIDEIGKMELCSEAFQQAVTEVMGSDHPILATIPTHRHPFLEKLRRRGDVTLIELTTANRD